MSFSFSCSNWKRAALAAESFLILVAVTGSQYTTTGFGSELAAVALGEEGGFLLPEPERLIGPSGGYYTFGAGAWSPKNGDEHDSQMNAVFGIVVSTGEKRRIQSQMGLVGRCLRPQSLQLFFQDLLVAWAWFSATCGT
jgi:hypothetical protein